MFTGIIEETGTIRSAERRGDILSIFVSARKILAGLLPGGSIAVNGCCLTAVAVTLDGFTCELTIETLQRTAFEERLKPGARVNLERPMRADGRFDGHIVQGHVDGVGRVKQMRWLGESAELAIVPPRELERYLVVKGSITVDGVSLTVASLGSGALWRGAHPVYTERDDPPGRGARCPGEPGGRRHREVRRTASAALTRPARGRPRRKRTRMPLSSIPEALDEIRAGRMVVVCDDEDRENEGDLTIAAEKVTADVINFMARFGRGLICLPMTGERLDELRIPLMVQDGENSAKFGTAFCVPIEAKQGTTTGISAGDRARTVLAAVDPRHESGRSGAARPHVPAARDAWRRAAALGSDRGGGGPGAARRPAARRASSARS